MIKTILVPTSGTQADANTFAAALAVASPLAAHVDFYHQRLSLCEAAVRSRHVQFSVGPALSDALEQLARRDSDLSAMAAKHFAQFCETHEVVVRQTPPAIDNVSANWAEETDQADERLMFYARHSDLVVLGRQHSNDLMPNNLIEWLLMGSGRPILIAPDATTTKVTGTVVVGWKETPEAARALAAAMPLLQRAQRVVLVSVEEKHAATIKTLEHLAQRLSWHGIAAEANFVRAPSTHPSAQLDTVAADLRADLLVVGGYGHTPLREAVCGGITRALIEHAELPVLMMH